MYRLSRAELLELARPFPIALRRIRWEALRLAIMRTIVATHREQLKAQAKASAPNSAPPPSSRPTGCRSVDCSWTIEYACPDSGASGTRGFAHHDGSWAFHCCCGGRYIDWTSDELSYGSYEE